MSIESNYKTYDAPRAIIEKFILKDGKFAEFVKEQTLLQSTNALGGRIFNPASFAANFGDYSLTNSTIRQLLAKLGSDVLGGEFTTDGKTFTRTLDNDIQKHFYDDVYEFKNDFPSDNGLLKKLIKGALNSLGQALGITVKPSRSIMAQALMYTMSQKEKAIYRDRKKIDSFDGTEWNSVSPDVLGEAQYIQPNARQAISYAYGNRLQIDRLKKYLEVKDLADSGDMHTAFRTKKLRLQKEYEDGKKITNILQKKFRRFIFGAMGDLTRSIFGKAAPLVDDFTGISGLGKSPNENYYYNKSEFAMAYLAKFYSHQFLRFMDETGKVTIKNDGTELNEIYDAQIEDIKRWSTEYIFEELKQDGVFTVNSSGNIIGDRAGSDIMSTDNNRLNKLKEATASSFKTIDRDVFGEAIQSPFIQHDALNRYGTPKVRSNTKTFQSTLEYADLLRQNDPITASDIFESVESAEAFVRALRPRDRVYVLLQDLRTDKTILLLPTFQSLTEDLNVVSNENDYFGRTEGIPVYHKTSRTLTLPLILYAQTPRELAMIYRKLDFIKSLAYPIMKDDFRQVQNPLVRISIGNIYKKVFGFLNTVSTTGDTSETPWEIENGWASPKKLDINVGFTVIHEKMPYVPSTNTFMRGEGDFTMHGVEYERILDPVSETIQPIEGEEATTTGEETPNQGQSSQDEENDIAPDEQFIAQSDTWFLIEHKETGARKIIQGKDVGKFPSAGGAAILQLPNKTGQQQLNDYKPIAKSTNRATLEAML